MSDGTTGFQVAPITEDEMSKVHDILRRAADAIVGMSQLKADVDTLSSKVAQLTDDAERLRKANAGLEESMYQARTQRQELEGRLQQAEQARITAQREASDWQSKANAAQSDADHLSATLADTKHERDDAQLRVMELEELLATAKAKLTSIHSALGITEAVQAKPEATIPPPSLGEVVQPTTEASPVPVAMTEPAPPTRRYYDTWQPGSSWDDDKRQYYLDF